MKNYFLERARKKENKISINKVVEVEDEHGYKIKLPPGIKIKLPSDLKPINYDDSRKY